MDRKASAALRKWDGETPPIKIWSFIWLFISPFATCFAFLLLSLLCLVLLFLLASKSASRTSRIDDVDTAHIEESAIAPTYSLPNPQAQRLTEWLTVVFNNKEEYRKLLSCEGSVAQLVLDLSIRLLDNTTGMLPSFEINLVGAAQRLTEKSGVSPTLYLLNDVTRLDDTAKAEGGTARIYKGRWRELIVCLKMDKLYQRKDPELVWKSMLKEAVLWGHIRHPNILPLYGVYRDKGMLSFVAPWMENGDMVSYLHCHQDSNRVQMACDVAQGLQFLHSKFIVHGDLKGMNVLVDDYGRACIGDFGFSSISDGGILTWTSQPKLASTGGTPQWQAPELFPLDCNSGGHEVFNTKASDIYAFGGVCYEIFAGQFPFANVNLTSVGLILHVKQGLRPPRPRDSSPSWQVWGLTEDIWSLLEVCWDAEPEKRPTIDVAVERLKNALPQDVVAIGGSVQSPAEEFRAMFSRSTAEVDMSVEMLESLLASILN